MAVTILVVECGSEVVKFGILARSPMPAKVRPEAERELLLYPQQHFNRPRPTKRWIFGLDVELLPLPNGFSELVVDGGDSFVTMNPGSP